ncbi:MAG TPA: hypothetical protein PKA36_14715 [Pseudoxanthomonas mexicana]|nr:hypothetical protein [Pseudoxanthomonas mexicana]
MAARKKPAKKAAVPALPKVLPVKVRYSTDTYIARARGVTASCTSSESGAARALARKLCYSVSADVRYVGTVERGVFDFEIVEINGRRSCRKCGCTQSRACAGGCHWVEYDLCSACAG